MVNLTNYRFHHILDLLEYAKNQQIITLHHYENYQKEIETLAYEFVYYLNYKQSTSIGVSEYQHVLKTINYFVMHGIADMHSFGEHSLRDYCEKGKLVVETDVEELREVYSDVYRTRLIVNHERYVNILEKQVPRYLEALQGYDKDFNYCYVRDDFDYPLFDGLPIYHHMYSLEGSDFVLYYLKRFSIEQKICSYVSFELPAFFKLFEKVKGVSISDVSMNLCSLCIYHILVNVYFYDKVSLFLQETDVLKLKDINNIEDFVCVGIEKLKEVMDIDCIEYMCAFKKNIQKEFENYVRNYVDLFVYPKQEVEEIVLTHTMTNSFDFMRVLDNLEMCSLEGKVAYLRSGKFSLFDIVDLLENDVFYGEEYIVYFQTLEPIDCALLLQIVFPDIRAFHNYRIQDWLQEICDLDWKNHFVRYLKSLEQADLEKIEENLKLYKVKWN